MLGDRRGNTQQRSGDFCSDRNQSCSASLAFTALTPWFPSLLFSPSLLSYLTSLQRSLFLWMLYTRKWIHLSVFSAWESKDVWGNNYHNAKSLCSVVSGSRIDCQDVKFSKKQRQSTPFYNHHFYKIIQASPNKQLPWISRFKIQHCTCDKRFIWSFLSMCVGICVCVCICTVHIDILQIQTLDTHMSWQHSRFKGWEFEKQKKLSIDNSVIKDIN